MYDNDSEEKKAIEYFKNVEIEDINDTEILQNVYNEIETIYEKLILNKDISHKFESLLKKSSYDQKIKIAKAVDIKIIETKLGSRVYENILQMIKLEVKEDDIAFLKEKINKKFVHYLGNENATYVIREFIHFNNKEDLLNYKSKILSNLDKIMDNEKTRITLQEYIKSTESTDILNEIFNKYFEVEQLFSIKSYFYQFFIENCSKATLDKFSEKIENDFLDLCFDRMGNYVVQTLIKTNKTKLDRYYSIILRSLKDFSRNNNIVFTLILEMVDNHEFSKKCHDLIKEFYMQGENDIFMALGVKKNDELDTKFSVLLAKLFNIDNQYNFNIFESFKSNIKRNWFYIKPGRTIIRAYLESTESNEKKQYFVKKYFLEYKHIINDYYGRELLELSKKYADNATKEEIKYLLKNNSKMKSQNPKGRKSQKPYKKYKVTNYNK